MKGMEKIFWIVVILIGLLYLTNITFGVIELLPDNLPIVGNVDEGVAGILIWMGLQKFGYFK
jgi:hypothetical protein